MTASCLRRWTGVLLFLTTTGHAAPVVYVAQLQGGAEVPPNGSAATGYAEVIMDTAAHTMSVATDFSGLQGGVTAAHIHCCTGPGANAGVATTTPTFPGFPSGVMAGTYAQTFDTLMASTYSSAFLTSNGGSTASAETALANGLASGLTYFNIHTGTFPGGEIRGQLLPLRVFANGFEGP